MSKDSVMKKIQRLLAKAYNNTSDDEAQSALLLAQKLMIKHGIDAQEVEKKEEKEEKVSQEIFQTQSIRAEWKMVLAGVIAQNFKCKYFFSVRNKSQAYIVFLGLSADAKIAKEIYAQTLEYMMKGRDRCYLKMRAAGKTGKGSKGDYVKGFLTGLKEAFENQVEEEGWGLVVTASPSVQKQWESMNFDPKLKIQTQKAKEYNDPEAIMMGYFDGKSRMPSKKRKKLAVSEG